MHNNSLEAFRRYGLPNLRPGSAVLEIGPDPDWLLRRLLEERGCRYHFADVSNAHPGLKGFVGMLGPYALDVDGDSFDAVVSANVIEHVHKPWLWLVELTRVVRPGGLVICVNPFSWPYHDGPLDCWRLLPDAYKALFEYACLEHVYSWHGHLVPVEEHWLPLHGPHEVTDTLAVGRRPLPESPPDGQDTQADPGPEAGHGEPGHPW